MKLFAMRAVRGPFSKMVTVAAREPISRAAAGVGRPRKPLDCLSSRLNFASLRAAHGMMNSGM